jgi:hypothetical protein
MVMSRIIDDLTIFPELMANGKLIKEKPLDS